MASNAPKKDPAASNSVEADKKQPKTKLKSEPASAAPSFSVTHDPVELEERSREIHDREHSNSPAASGAAASSGAKRSASVDAECHDRVKASRVGDGSKNFETVAVAAAGASAGSVTFTRNLWLPPSVVPLDGQEMQASKSRKSDEAARQRYREIGQDPESAVTTAWDDQVDFLRIEFQPNLEARDPVKLARAKELAHKLSQADVCFRMRFDVNHGDIELHVLNG